MPTNPLSQQASKWVLLGCVLLTGLFCLATVLTFNPLVFLLIFLGGFSLVAVSLRPDTCLWAFLFLLPCVPRTFFTRAFVLPVGFDFGRIYFPFLFLGIVFFIVRTRSASFLPHKAHRWLLLWIFTETLAFTRSIEMKSACLQRFVPFLAAVMCYVLLQLHARKAEQLERVLKIFLAATVVILGIGILEIAAGRSLFWTDEFRVRAGHYRLGSTLENPQVLGSYLLMCIPLALYFWGRYKTANTRMIFIALVGWYILTILLTFTRSAWLGMLIIGFLLSKNKKAVLVFGFLAAVVLISPAYTKIIKPVLEDKQALENVFHRFYIYKKAVAVFLDHPFFGVGLDNFGFFSMAYDKEFVGLKQHLHDPGGHNTYLLFATEQGIIGFFAVIAFVVTSLRSVFPLYKDSEKYGQIGELGKMLFVSMIAFLVTGLTYEAFQWATLIAPLMVMMACCQITGTLALREVDLVSSPQPGAKESTRLNLNDQ